MKRTPIIVGIDPGTTIGYACLSVDGKLLALKSSKGMNFAQVLKEISEIGLPIIVSGDKESVPDFVRQFSAKSGARLLKLNSDVSVQDKRILAKEYPTKNDHERDSLAAALLAYKKIRVLLKKIKRYIKINQKEKIAHKIFQYVIVKELSINLAVSIIEDSNKPEKKIIKNALTKGITNYSTKILEKLNNLLDKIEILNNENKELKKIIREKNQEIRKASIRKPKEKIGLSKTEIEAKDSKIKKLLKKNKELTRRQRKDRKDLIAHKRAIKDIHSYSVLRRLERISKESLEKSILSFGKLKNNETILIDNTSSISPIILKTFIKKHIKLIGLNIPKNIKKEIMSLQEAKIKLIKAKDYCFANRKDLQKELEKKTILEDVIKKYKKTRQETA